MTLIDHRDPFYEHELDLVGFRLFLEGLGADIREPTNPWEVLRFAFAQTGVSIIYKNKRGHLTYTNIARDLYQEFAITAEPQPEAQFKLRTKKPTISSTIDPTILEKWGRIETDPPCEPTEHHSQPEDGGQPSSDHSEDVPW